MTRRLEQDLLHRIMLALPKRGLWWRQNVGQAWTGTRAGGVLFGIRPIRFGVPGQADILGCLDGSAIAIEVKSPCGRQSADQKRFEAAWSRAGGVYILARGVTDVTERLS